MSIITNAQIIKATGTVGTSSQVDINAQTIITNLRNTDGASIITRNSTTTLSNGCDLIWGAFYQNQPNNPGIFSLMSTSAIAWYSCFTVRANGNTGIFNPNPGVALEIGSSSSIRQLKVNGNIVLGSDIKMKENIKDLTNSLDYLKRLQGVSYNMIEEEKEEKIPEKFLNESPDIIESLKSEISKAPRTNEYLLNRRFYGFIAQDVQKLFPDLVYADDEGMLSIDYIGMIPLLVTGLQEQQNMIENQKKEINILKETLNLLYETGKANFIDDIDSKSAQSLNLATQENTHNEEMKVYQNAPNPFNMSTTITCYIPQKIKKVQLCVYNMQGTQIKCFTVSERGTVNVIIESGQLSSGTYTYLLIGDGKASEAKMMIVTN
ncbi:MAG: tail fiber domain-containing protein [Bacteroidales bacterium]|nr:tail fiber domain-containing protein [Bacteroidales bacterium]